MPNIATFNGFEIYNGTGDTVLICLGFVDCINFHIVTPGEPPNILFGASMFWCTRFTPGLTWRETDTWTTPPQYGSFFGSPQNPDYVFGVPPGEPPADPLERGKWVHAWALETRAANPVDSVPRSGDYTPHSRAITEAFMETVDAERSEPKNE
jgi:hypothetical protein